MIVALLIASAHAAMLDRVAAVVNEEPIALSELYDLGGEYIANTCPGQTSGACVLQAENEVLDSVLERVLVRQTLQKLDLDVSGAEVDRGIDSMVEQYGVADRTALREGFESQGVSWETVREQISDEIRMMKFQENVIRPRITVSDNDIEDMYQRMIRDVVKAPQIELAAFSVPVPEGADRAALKAELDALVAEINAGTRDWLATVKERDGGKFAPRDGVMGTFKASDLAKPLAAVVTATAVGQVAPAIDVGTDLLVLKIVSTRTEAAGVKPLAEVREQLVGEVYQQKGESEMETWYAQAKRDATIRVLLSDQ